MSNNRSRWMWPVFCAGLLAGNLASHLWPAPAATAAPADQNEGLPALRAEFNKFKANPIFDGPVTFRKNGQTTLKINDTQAIIAILSCAADQLGIDISPVTKSRLDGTEFHG